MPDLFLISSVSDVVRGNGSGMLRASALRWVGCSGLGSGYRIGVVMLVSVDSAVFVPLVGFVRSWFDQVNGNTYFAGDIWEVSTGRVIPLPFQYGANHESAIRSAAVDLGHLRLVFSVVEVATEEECRHGGALQFCGELRGAAAVRSASVDQLRASGVLS